MGTPLEPWSEAEQRLVTRLSPMLPCPSGGTPT